MVATPIRVLIADDHALVRAGFASLLAGMAGVTVVGEAGDGHEALQLIPQCVPDIVLMDISMPELNGIDVTARVKRDFPNVRVAIMSMHANVEYARRALRAGATAYLLKDASTAELELALRAVARGETYLTSVLAASLLSDSSRPGELRADPIERLTPRQREVLQLIAEGHSRREIAEKLQISPRTFDTYRAQLMDTLQIHDAVGLVRFAVRAGLVPPDQ